MIRAAALEAIAPIDHAFTTRLGGQGSTPFDTFNLAFHVGDDPAQVRRHHDQLAGVLGYARDRLVHLRQIHSDRIIYPDADAGFETPLEGDALITDRPGQALMVMSADCTPLLIADPDRPAIAAVHAGRAGAFADIAGQTVREMAARFGSDPARLVAVLGPSIHVCCYEVNAAIADEAAQRGYPDAVRSSGAHIFLDVNAIIRRQLIASGLTQVESIDACTACENGRFFSYRADRQHTGRQAGVIRIR